MWKRTLRIIGFGRPELHKGLLEEKYFELKRAFHHGVQTNPTCMAYDPIQKILAIGAKDGTIKILGKPGLEVLLESQFRCPIRRMEFLTNKARLIVFFDFTVEEWDIESCRPIASRVFKSRITAHHIYTNSSFIFLGTEEGDVAVLSTSDLTLSSYDIPFRQTRGDHQTRGLGMEVSALETCPCADNQLLIGFSDALVVLWNLKARKITRKYFAPTARLNTLAWHSDGKQFITGHNDGEMCIWRVKETKKPFQQMYSLPVLDEREVVRPISKIFWTLVKGEDMIILQGGTGDIEDDGLVILQGSSYERTLVAQNGPYIDIVACHSSPWPGDSDPAMIITLNENSQLSCFGVSRSLGFPKLPSPPSLLFQDSQIVGLQFHAGCSKALFSDLFAAGSVRFDPAHWLKGGQFSKDLVMGEDLLITCHDTGKMRFWDASSIALRLLLTLNVGAPTSNTSGEDSRKKSAAGINCSMQYVTKFLFCPVSRILLVGCASGTVFVYNFSTNKTIVEKKVYKHYKKKSSKDLQEPSRQGGSSKSSSGNEGSTRKKVSKIAEEAERRKNKGEKEEVENPAPLKKDAGHPTSAKKSSSEDLAPTKTASPPTTPATLPAATATPTTTTPTTTTTTITTTADGAPSGQPAEMPWMPSNRPAKKVRAKPGKPAPNQGLEPQPPIKSPPVLASSTRHVPSAASNEKAMLSASTPAVRTSPREGGGGLGVSVAESTSVKQTSPQIPPSKPSPATSPQPGQKKPESPAAVAKNSDSPQQTPPARTPSPAPQKTESPSAVARQSADGTVAAPGLRLVLECTLNGVVKALAMALNLHMIAIGDQLGVLTLVDIETGEGLFSHNVSVSGSEPIRCLTFSEAMMDQQDYERWQELHYGGQQQQEEEQRIPTEPVLFIGGEYGTVSVLRLEEMEWRPCFEKRVGGESFAIIFLAVVTAKGKPITLASVEWEETEAVASGGDGEDGEDVDKEVEDFVEIEANGEGKDKDKEKEREALQEKRKKKKKAKAEAPYNGERFLLVCAENQIAIYSIPFFEQLAKVDLTTAIVAAHLLCYKGEWCLLTFDNEIGINVYTLTDLRPILESDWNFFEGPEMTPTAILNAVVSLDGRLIAASAKSELHRLSFFLHENLLNLPGSLPALHVRGLKMPEKPKALTKSMFSDGNISDAGDLFGTPAPSSTRNARGNKPVLEEFADDDEELMPKKATGEKDRNGRQPRTATGSRVRDQRGQVGDVKNVMAENINKVNERGERLSELQMKSSELEAASEEYLHNIREWTKKQRNKKWYQL